MADLSGIDGVTDIYEVARRRWDVLCIAAKGRWMDEGPKAAYLDLMALEPGSPCFCTPDYTCVKHDACMRVRTWEEEQNSRGSDRVEFHTTSLLIEE